ncbi:MAG: hypothetical protein JOZ18_10395, partial [Chloroflexi bacterium]|nr:hypothetical protein [Chloroflexota bacterium]
MSNHYYVWLPVKIFIGCFLALVSLLYLSPAQATYATASGGLTLQVDVGFDATYKDGYWTPVRVSLNNDGPDFQGTLSVST